MYICAKQSCSCSHHKPLFHIMFCITCIRLAHHTKNYKGENERNEQVSFVSFSCSMCERESGKEWKRERERGKGREGLQYIVKLLPENFCCTQWQQACMRGCVSMCVCALGSFECFMLANGAIHILVGWFDSHTVHAREQRIKVYSSIFIENSTGATKIKTDRKKERQ